MLSAEQGVTRGDGARCDERRRQVNRHENRAGEESTRTSPADSAKPVNMARNTCGEQPISKRRLGGDGRDVFAA